MTRKTLESISCPTRLRTAPSEMPSCLAIAVKAARPSFCRILMMVRSTASSAADLAGAGPPELGPFGPERESEARLTTVKGLFDTAMELSPRATLIEG